MTVAIADSMQASSPPYDLADSLRVGPGPMRSSGGTRDLVTPAKIILYSSASPSNGTLTIWAPPASYQIVSVTARADTLSGTSGTADVLISAAGTAGASGTSALSTAIDLTSATMTASTNYAAPLSATQANLQIGTGMALSVKLAGTQGGTANLCITIDAVRI